MIEPIDVNVLEQNAYEKLPCIKCGAIEDKLVHIRMNPLGQHGQPLGGVYCSMCAMTLSVNISIAALEAMKS